MEGVEVVHSDTLLQQLKNRGYEEKSLRDKIVEGLDYSFKQLIKTKKKQNGTFVWSINGEIVHVKAKDVKLK